jgi:hypothetical protein
MRTRDEVELLLRAGGGLVVRRDHPELGGSFDWLIREGRLATVLHLRCATGMLCWLVPQLRESRFGRLRP